MSVVYKNNKKVITTSIDKDLLKELKIRAAQEDRRMNDIIEDAIKNYLRGEK